MKQFFIALIVVLIAGGVYLWWQGNLAMPETPSVSGFGSPSDTDMEVVEEETDTSAPMAASVSYNGSSFSLSPVTIQRGGTVTWTSTGPDMWVASAMHPTHTGYEGTTLQEHCAPGATLSFDQCAPGASYSFTFDKVGTWNYHDHTNASAFGSVIVVE